MVMTNEVGGDELKRLANLAEDERYQPLYDDSPPMESADEITLNAGLTDEQITDALFWHQFRNGVMLVSAEAGEGKGVFGNMVAWKFKRYFPGCKLILDYLPRRPMGFYHYFDKNFIVKQVDRMALLAKGEVSDDYELPPDYEVPKEKVENFRVQAKEWVSSEGEVFFQNSIAILDEYRRRHNKRRPHDPLGILLTDIYNVRRHLNTLIMGITVKPRELDDKTCIPHVKYHVKMRRACKVEDIHNARYHTFVATMHKVKYDTVLEKLVNLGKPYSFLINAARPRPEIGEKPEDYKDMTFDPKSPYYCWYDLFNSENAIALNIPKSLRKEQ